MTSIKKAVFPVAGLGTRFLPATKANPKEMLPVVDKPLIQYAVEEAIAAGAEVLIFVTGRNKRAIEDHFDRAFELEETLASKGKADKLKLVREIVPDGVQCVHIRQPEALGLGHAVLCARNIVGDEPFYVILADDLIACSGKNCLSQMQQVHVENSGSVLGVQRIARKDASKYGVIGTEESGNPCKISEIVEKPDPDDAPSELGVIGRYLLTPEIFNILEKTPRGTGGEIQLTDAIAELLKQELVMGLEFEGKRYDCGSKLGYLQATVELGRKHPELGEEFSRYLDELMCNK